jgi:ornithine cyclodeaminase
MTEILVLAAQDVERCLDHTSLVDAMDVACREVSTQAAVMPVRLTMRLPAVQGFVSSMPAFLPGPGALATKLVTAFAGNPSRNLPLIMGIVVLNDAETGQPLAIMDGAMVTGLRTAATSALSCRVLGRADARTLAIIGSGLQAGTHIDAITRVRSIAEVRVSSRTADGAATFVRSFARSHANISIHAATDAEAAVRGADIVVCASTSSEPVLRASWLKPGAHICGIGSHAIGKRELDSETVAGCAVIAADTRAGCLAEADDIRIPISEGRISVERVVELGEILMGTQPGRQTATEITLYKSVGMAAMDAAAARLAYDTALSVGVGVRVEL